VKELMFYFDEIEDYRVRKTKLLIVCVLLKLTHWLLLLFLVKWTCYWPQSVQIDFNILFFFSLFQTNIGPILLSINPYNDVGNPLTLSSTRTVPLAPQLRKIVQEAVRQQAETGYPQAIILSGTSGAGKTHCSMLLLRQLFAVAGGGPETDAFKHLAAAFTVLRSLGSAKTATNSESSRIVSNPNSKLQAWLFE
jgi:hypothetical protein